MGTNYQWYGHTKHYVREDLYVDEPLLIITRYSAGILEYFSKMACEPSRLRAGRDGWTRVRQQARPNSTVKVVIL